jgi:hypothetical protein
VCLVNIIFQNVFTLKEAEYTQENYNRATGRKFSTSEILCEVETSEVSFKKKNYAQVIIPRPESGKFPEVESGLAIYEYIHKAQNNNHNG